MEEGDIFVREAREVTSGNPSSTPAILCQEIDTIPSLDLRCVCVCEKSACVANVLHEYVLNRLTSFSNPYFVPAGSEPHTEYKDVERASGVKFRTLCTYHRQI